MYFLRDNVATIAVALVMCVGVWMHGGSVSAEYRMVMPWLWALMLEAMVFFPQRHEGETTREARDRVWEAMRADPLTWVSLGLMVLLAIPFVNHALCPNCDWYLVAQGFSTEPPLGFLPYCVDRLDHLTVFLWFLLAVTSALAVRHSLTKRGKRLLLEMVVWNGMGLVAIGVVQQALKAPGPLWMDLGKNANYFFSVFGYANKAADYFTTLFLLSIALWRFRVDEVRREEVQILQEREVIRGRFFWRKHYLLIPAVLYFFATMNTLSRAGIILVAFAASLAFLHATVTFLSRMKKAQRVKASIVSAVVIILITVFSAMFMSDDLHKEINTINTQEMFSRVSGRGTQERAARELWREHRWLGCGGWGFSHLMNAKLTEAERQVFWPTGMSNVHNDCLQFLCEHGVIGFGLILAVFVLLLAPLVRTWAALAKSVRFLRTREPPPPPQAFFIYPAGAFFILVAVTFTIIHSFADCPLRSGSILPLLFVELAAADGFLPTLVKEEDDDDERERHHHHHHHHSGEAEA